MKYCGKAYKKNGRFLLIRKKYGTKKYSSFTKSTKKSHGIKNHKMLWKSTSKGWFLCYYD